MRITGGTAKGIIIKVLPKAGLRPATDRMREALFAHLGPSIEGMHFLDLFAGTGAYGLEALSRGAASGVFVEHNRHLLTGLKANLAAATKSLGYQHEPCSLVLSDSLKWKPKSPNRFDLIFVDPPYPLIRPHAATLFDRCVDCLSAHVNARVLFEMPSSLALCPPPWKIEHRLGSRRRYAPSIVVYSIKKADKAKFPHRLSQARIESRCFFKPA